MQGLPFTLRNLFQGTLGQPEGKGRREVTWKPVTSSARQIEREWDKAAEEQKFEPAGNRTAKVDSIIIIFSFLFS